MRKPQRHALRWFAFSSNVGERWTVILATAPFIAAIHEEGAPAAVGLTIFDLSIVVVDCGLSRAEQDETLLHELMHVASHDKRGLHRGTEERAISHISPSLHPLCVAIGGMAWPARPAGIAALEKLAQSFHTLGGHNMAADLWTREQRLAAVEALARIPRGQLKHRVDEISRATGRIVTTDSLKAAFRLAGLNPPSSYTRDADEDDEPATPRSVGSADTDRPPRDADGEPVLSRSAEADLLRAQQAKLRAEADALDARIGATVSGPPVILSSRKGPTVEMLYSAIKGAPISLSDLCNKLDLSPAKAAALIEEATAKGIDVHLENDHVGFRSKTPADRVHDTEIPPVVGSRQLVGVISDTHLGSKWCLRSRLIDFVDHAYARGVREILHPGDILDGQYHHSTFEVSHVGLDAQIEDLFQTLPQRPGLTYHAIAGNHDHTFTAKSGVNVGRAIVAAFRDRGRHDFKYYGERSAYVRVRGALVHLWHPGGGGSYARSYKLQKRVENYSSGEKPAIMLAGHWHQFCHVYERGVHAIACPTFHGGGSEFSNMLGTSQAIGGLLLSWESTAGGTLRNFAVEPRLYFERERVHTITEADEDAA